MDTVNDLGNRVTPVAGYPPAQSPDALSPQRVLSALRRQAWWIAGTALLVVAFTVALTLGQRPVFEARATLRIETPGTSAEPGIFSALMSPSNVETEMEILKSRTVAADVVDALGLNMILAAGRGTELRDMAQPVSAAEAARGRTQAAAALRSALQVTRPQPTAAIVAVSYESFDPGLARDVVNAVARSYLALRNRIQTRQAQTAVAFLDDQVAAIGNQLRDAEAELERFRRQELVVSPEIQANEQVRRYAELTARREELGAQLATLQEVLDLTRAGGSRTETWAAYATTLPLVANDAMSGLIQQISIIETERSRLLGGRTQTNPEMVSLNETLSLLETRLARIAESQLRVIESEIHAVDGSLARASAELGGVPALELEYARRLRQVDLMSELYTLLQTRLKEAEISEAVELANIHVVDSAIAPLVPVRPRKVMNLLFGATGGLLLGAIVGLVREMSDTRVRSRQEVLELTGVPLLAAIPRVTPRNGRGIEPAERVARRLVVRNAPRSPAAEAYRALRTSIAFSNLGRDKRLRTLVVTSAEPEDGKTKTVVNLAVTLAEQGLKVVVVEADQRRPLLHQVFHVQRVPGLTDALAGSTTLDAVVHRVPLPEHASGTLDFLAGGTSVPNPAELAGSSAMKDLLAQLAERFDAVVLDTPPLSTVTDAAVTGTFADGVIIVARMGATRREALRRAVEELQAVGAHVVGAVLTDVHHSEDRYGYRYGHRYYYDGDGAPPAG